MPPLFSVSSYDQYFAYRGFLQMSDVSLETNDDVETEGEDPFGDMDSEHAEIESLNQTLDTLFQASHTLETYGLNRTTFEVMRSTNLLAGTALESLAAADFTATSAPQDPETQMAIEALGERIKEKLGAWSAKVVNFVKNIGDKVTSVLTSLKDSIVAKGAQLSNATWNAAKATGQTIKAHPFKTVIIALSAAAIVASIVAMFVAPGTYATTDSIRAFLTNVAAKVKNIQFPGKVRVDITNTPHGPYVIKYASNGSIAAARPATAAELGWSQTAVRSINNQFNKIWNVTKTSVSKIGSTVTSAAKKVDGLGMDPPDKIGQMVAEKTGSNLTGWISKKLVDKVYMTILWGAVGVVAKLVKDVMIRAFRVVSETFSQLESQTKQTAKA